MTGTVAVTGATGYLGGLLTEHFTKEGWDIVRLVRSPARAEDRRFQLGNDVSSESLEGIDLLIHAAYDMKVVSEADIWRVNVEGTRRLLEAASKTGVERNIVISSMSAYEGTRQLYGRAKLSIERLAADSGAVIVRPGLVIAPDAGGMAGSLAKLIRLPVVPSVGGAGHQFLINEADFAEVVHILATADSVPKEPLGLAYREPIPFRLLLELLAEMQGCPELKLMPVPWQLTHAVLRLGERLQLKLPFRSDSLLGLIRPAAFVPGIEQLAAMGISIPSPASVRDLVQGRLHGAVVR